MASRFQNCCIATIVVILLGASILPFVSNVTSKEITGTSVSASDALRVVEHKLMLSDKTGYTAESPIAITQEGQLLFYVVTLQPTGYVVVPSYRFLPVVMAYSWSSEFGAYSFDNPLYRLLVLDITSRLAGAALLPDKLLDSQSAEWDQFLTETPNRLFEQWPPEGSSPTDGWVQTLWDQGAPYNDMCPLIDGARSAAGCPAVAMSQILAYFNTTNSVQFTDADDYHHNYGGADFWIDNDYLAWQFPSWPQLNMYLQTVESHWASHTSLTNQDKAALNVACGFAMEQVYNPSGSGTFGVDQAYQAYQRFGFTDSILFMGESQRMFGHLAHDMKQAVPAHLAIVNDEQPPTVGHNVVVDGYNTDDYYHINFGWSGSYNGWYHIPDDLPYELTVVEGVIADIVPVSNQAPSIQGSIHGPAETQVTLWTTYWVDAAADPEGDPLGYQWDWGDGTSSNQTGNSSSHAWDSEGTYNVRVKVTDCYDAESSWSEPLPVTVTEPKPLLVIVPSSHGIGITAKIENQGAANATNVVWTLNVSGGLLNLVHIQNTDTIASIQAGRGSLIQTGKFFGLGTITVEFTARCLEGNTTTLTKEGRVLLVWVRLT
jgi:hypothetical protein